MDAQTVISILTWLLIAVGGGFVATITWFAIRVVTQLDRLERLLSEQAGDLDRRVSLLEQWSEMVGKWPRGGGTGITP